MISLTAALLVGMACVVVEAFFSGSEIALVSADRERLRQRASRGEPGASVAYRLLSKPEVFLATTLMGTNLATVTFSVTTTLALVSGESAVSGLWAIAIVTPMTLILGEALPKVLFQQHADRIVTKIAYPLHVASLVLRPGVWLISRFAMIMSRLVGAGGQPFVVTRADLSHLVELGDIGERKRTMISNVLELSNATAADVMIPLSEMALLPETATIAEAAAKMTDTPHSRMPVYRSRVDDVVGILRVFDVLEAKTASTRRSVGEVVAPARFVPRTRPAVDVLVELQGSGDEMVVVVDEYGGAVGIVTKEDVLEEIVGEIEDEFDVEASPVRVRPGVWHVEGRTSIERINRELRLDLPKSDQYESVSGLILERLRRIPEPGARLVVQGVAICVVAASERAVEEVQLARHVR